MYRLYLGLEPWTASAHFPQTWLFMQPSLAAKFPLEVLDRICNVNRVAIYSCLFHAGVQKFPRWSDERLSGLVFLISRLFADEHDRRVCGSLSEYGLRGFTEKVASPAVHGGALQRSKIVALWEKWRSGGVRCLHGHAKFDALFMMKMHSGSTVKDIASRVWSYAGVSIRNCNFCWT
jgi:hypothetical protein